MAHATAFAERPTGAEVLETVRAQREDFVRFLESLTLAESPSLVAESQRDVQRILTDAFTELDYRTTFVPGNATGGHLYARPRRRDRHRRAQLLLGHHDTVWPLGTLDTMPFSVEGDIVKGPGVYDMKGGLTQAVFALRTLAHMDLEPLVTPVIFTNSDEEIGSRESTRHIRSLAPRMNRVFVLEPSLGLSGHIKTTRKGVGKFTIIVKGKAAHAGLDADRGVSAILELSHVIQQLFSLNDAEKGITVNVGTIDGGLRPNVVAPESKAVVDVRVQTQRDAEAIQQAIYSLKPSVPGTEIEVQGAIGRPALEATPRNQVLWRLAKELGTEIGLELDEGLAGGGSDGNTTSQLTATLDGLGAVGDGAHAHHEFISIDKTLERTALLALLMLAPPVSDPGGATDAS